MSRQHNKRAQKHQQFSKTATPKRNNLWLGIALLATFGFLAIGIFTSKSGEAPDVSKATPVGGAGQREIRIPLQDVSDGNAKFFTYKSAVNKVVQFFAIKSSDGVYRVAANACVICYREKKGFHQEGNDIVCNKCRRHFPSVAVNEVTGGCNPDAIPRTIQDNNIVIQTAELENKTELF